MKHVLSIALFTVVVTAFYNYVGQLVPQKEVHPPSTAEIRADMSIDEMAEAGRIIYEGEGTCNTCHDVSDRFPPLANIGAVAGARRPGMSDVEYLAESLYEPDAYIVEPYAPGMPAAHRPPIGLSDAEILTVIAYLQSRGGTPTVTMSTELKYQGQTVDTPPPPSADDGDLDGQALLAKYGCMACHSIDQPIRMVGPSLYDIGSRQSRGEIYESLVYPDEIIVEGYPPGVMGAMLQANGFFTQMTTAQLQTMVDYLHSLKGGE